ncbi:hypothetical protein V8C26DRAFT_246316 [Trichoderma gracile]
MFPLDVCLQPRNQWHAGLSGARGWTDRTGQDRTGSGAAGGAWEMPSWGQCNAVGALQCRASTRPQRSAASSSRPRALNPARIPSGQAPDRELLRPHSACSSPRCFGWPHLALPCLALSSLFPSSSLSLPFLFFFSSILSSSPPGFFSPGFLSLFSFFSRPLLSYISKVAGHFLSFIIASFDTLGIPFFRSCIFRSFTAADIRQSLVACKYIYTHSFSTVLRYHHCNFYNLS